ncbi:hypothetical protein ILFOPFJJ_05943 [Ensifer psoraleae]|nr:hypothetical protein [Sinorhizobium psoraleae]
MRQESNVGVHCRWRGKINAQSSPVAGPNRIWVTISLLARPGTAEDGREQPYLHETRSAL